MTTVHQFYTLMQRSISRKRCAWHSQEMSLLYYPSNRKKGFSLVQQQAQSRGNLTTQPMRRYHRPEFSLFSNGLSFKVSPSNYKVPLLCLLNLPIVFAIACLSKIANLCYSQIKPFFYINLLFFFYGDIG